MGPVLINGVNYSWANILFAPYGIPLTLITSIKWDREIKVEANYGAGQEPVSVGFGEVKYSGSIKVYKEWWMAVKAASPGGDPFNIPLTDVAISYGGSRVAAVTEILQNFFIYKDGLDGSQGQTKLEIELPFFFAGVKQI